MSKRSEPGGSPQKQPQQMQSPPFLSSIASLVQSTTRTAGAAAADHATTAASSLSTPPPKKRRVDATDATTSPQPTDAGAAAASGGAAAAAAAAAVGAQRGHAVGFSFELPPLVDPTVIAARLREQESPVSPTVAANFVRRSSRAKRPPSPVVAAHAGEPSPATLYMDSPHRTAGGVVATSLPLERQMALTQQELQSSYPAVSSTVRLQLNRDPAKGLCVSALSYIPKDSFVLEYAGDLLTNAESEEVEEAYYREHTLDTVGCYMFWFKFKRKIYCIDSTAPGPGEKPGTTLEQHLKPYLPPLSPMGAQRTNSNGNGNQSAGSRSNSRNASPTKHNGAAAAAAAAPMSPPPARASPSPAPASPAPVAFASSWASADTAAAAVAAIVASPRSFSTTQPAPSSSLVAPAPVLASIVPASSSSSSSSSAPGSMCAPPAPRVYAAVSARASPPPPRLESLGYGYARYINHSRHPNLMVRVLDCPSAHIRTNRFDGAADPMNEERKQHIRRQEANGARGAKQQQQQQAEMPEQEESKEGSAARPAAAAPAAAAAAAAAAHGGLLSGVPLNLFKSYPRLCFFAARAISGGEELTIDYGDRDQDSIEQHPWLKG